MGRKASAKRKVEVGLVELNLNSMMDLFSNLIPALLMMSAVVEVTVLNVSTPSIGSAGSASQPDKPPEKLPLNLTLTVTDKGYILTGNGANLPVTRATSGPTFPLVQRPVKCQIFRGTWPPPRAKNRSLPKCVDPSEVHNFWIYDNDALTKKIIEIKDAFPDERRVVIVAEPDAEFEVLVDAMDATRDTKPANGPTRVLFDEVVLSPGMF